jgi:phospholipid/cholesterol/gamma-HCH transport system ATP-binding protein
MRVPNLLQLQAVSKSFVPGVPVLTELSVEIPLEGVTYVVGQSGSGKSVLCRLAVGLLKADGGKITLLGQPVQALPERDLLKLRRQIPYLVQGPALLDWLTVEENVALAGDGKPSEKSEQALARVGLVGLSRQYPMTLGPGAQKREAIARALMLEPRYLMLDEPTTGLDRGAARQVNAAISSLRDQGLGALVVSHDYRSLEQTAERVLLIDRGKVGFFGNKDEFLSSDDPRVRALTGPHFAEATTHG